MSTKLPGDIVSAHNAHDIAAELLFDDRPPRHEAEAEAVIDHGETPAGKLSCADEPAAYGLPVLNRPEAEAAFRGYP